MDLEKFYGLMRSERLQDAHRYLDDALKQADEGESTWIHYRRTGVYISEGRYQDAISHLQKHRGVCGTVISVHNTLAMIYEILGKDDLALNELETAPYEADQENDPLLTADTRFYRVYFKVRRGLTITKAEIHEFPEHYETYLPDRGKMRGALVRKSDIVDMMKSTT